MKIHQQPSREIRIDNETYLYFGGTAYLGLSTHKKYKNILIQNILHWGTGYGSSRNANIKLSAYDKGEQFLAEFIKSEAALTVSSGMLAGKIIIELITPLTDCFFNFPNTHTAIKTNNSQPIFIGKKINPRLIDDKIENITILCDAVPSNQITPIDLTILESIPKNKTITLIIDESHSLGILGANGCGIFSSINSPNINRKIMVSSLGKSFGLNGGVIASDIDFITKIKFSDNFISSAGMNPAFVQTLFDSKEIYNNQRIKLTKNLDYIRARLKVSENFKFNPNYPVIYIDNQKLNKILIENKIIITNFNYSNPKKQLNRIVFTASHKKKDLDKIIRILNQFSD